MRPLLLVTVDWPPIEGGIASVATGLARSLAKLGERVVVVAPRLAGARELEQAGVEVVTFPFYQLGPLRLIPVALVTLLVAARIRPRALLALNVAYGGVLGRLLALVGLPYLVYAYGFEFLKHSRSGLARSLLRSIYGRAQRVIAISRFARDGLVALGVPPERIDVLPPGVEAGPEPSAALATDHRPYVLTVTRLVRRKGLDVLAAAMESVLALRRDLSWVIVGRGPEEARLRALTTARPFEGRVKLTGRVQEETLEALYRQATLFALTPVELPGDAEGFGIVYLEAALRGLASVASRTGGVPEAVEHGRTGIVVPAGDVEATTRAVLELLDDSALRERLGRQGRERALTLGWDSVARRVARLCGAPE